MEKELEKCPICGSKIKKVINLTNGEYFYKCSNDSCHFCVGLEYEASELLLQGKKLKTKCQGCGSPLKIACGPHGLYARCYNCDYDLVPKKIGKTSIQMWANAYSEEAQSEIEVAINNFEESLNIDYGFVEAGFTKSQEKVKSNKKAKKVKKIKSSQSVGHRFNIIIDLLAQDENTPLSAIEISRGTGLVIGTIRTYLKQLRATNEIKIVDWDASGAGPAAMYYQVKTSPVPELEIKSRADGYDTIGHFCQAHKDELGKSIVPATFSHFIRKENFNYYPFLNGSGLVKAYKVEDLEQILSKYFQGSKKPKRKYQKKTTKKLGKRKYTRRVKTDPVVGAVVNSIPTEKSKGLLARIFKINKKSSSTPDFITY